MSIGTWILMGFSAFRRPRRRRAVRLRPARPGCGRARGAGDAGAGRRGGRGARVHRARCRPPARRYGPPRPRRWPCGSALPRSPRGGRAVAGGTAGRGTRRALDAITVAALAAELAQPDRSRWHRTDARGSRRRGTRLGAAEKMAPPIGERSAARVFNLLRCKGERKPGISDCRLARHAGGQPVTAAATCFDGGRRRQSPGS